MTPEGKIKSKGRSICDKLGVYHFPVQQQGTSRAGIPDDCLCVGGLFVTIEYKAHMNWEKRTKTAIATLPTAKQVLEMERIRNTGGVTLVVDDQNIDSLGEGLLQFMRESLGEAYFRLEWSWRLADYKSYTEGFGELIFAKGMTIPKFKKC